jgi:hypothetical protein
MEAALDIQWMRKEKFDGEEKEAVSEEDTCEGQSQRKARSEEGSQETRCKESYKESCRENCQEALCGGIQASREKNGGEGRVSRLIEASGGPSPRQEIREAVRV